MKKLNTPKQAKVSLTTESQSLANDHAASSASSTTNYEQKSLGQVSGTPLWMFSNTPKQQSVQQLPSRDQFQQGICDHLPFENLPSYQTEKVGRIVSLSNRLFHTIFLHSFTLVWSSQRCTKTT